MSLQDMRRGHHHPGTLPQSLWRQHMGVSRGTKPITGTVAATSTTYVGVMEGPIMLCYGASNLRIAGWLRGITGNFRAKARYRTFDARRENPGAWTDFGTAKA